MIATLGIGEGHVRKFYRGMVKFEGSIKNRKVKDDESKSQEDYVGEPECEIKDEIEETEAIHDREEEEEQESIELEVLKPSRRIVMVEDMEELREKEQQEQEAK